VPAGHWNPFAQFVVRRYRHGDQEHGIDLDVKLFFGLTNAVFDAGICAWDNKCRFASVRPITAIRFLHQGRQVAAWAGPDQGTRTIDGAAWLPYEPSTFPTPPFPEYSSPDGQPHSARVSPAAVPNAPLGITRSPDPGPYAAIGT
jgi:hypothetical protein